MENSYEGVLLEPSQDQLLITVDGVNYTVEQVRQRLKYFQSIVKMVAISSHVTIFHKELFRRFPDIETTECKPTE